MKMKTSISVGLITFAVLTVLSVVAPIRHWVGDAQTSIRVAGLPPGRAIYALTTDQSLYVLGSTATQYSRLGRVNTDGSNLIGIDFRPADGQLYGLTDRGTLYTISLTNFGTATLISTMSPRFTGGFGLVMDFNPVVNALRVAGGSAGQNLAQVNSAGGNLNMTVAQTRFTYAAGDPNAGRNPEITGGAYDNNRNGATTTTFYVIDHDRDTLCTIATRVNGSSATATGVIKTIGTFTDPVGNRQNMSPLTNMDIYTDQYGNNFLVGQTTRLLFTVNLANVNPNLPVGTTQNVVATRGVAGIQLAAGSNSLSGGVADIAVK